MPQRIDDSLNGLDKSTGGGKQDSESALSSTAEAQVLDLNSKKIINPRIQWTYKAKNIRLKSLF